MGAVGNHTICLGSKTLVAGTAYYPASGNGDTTTDASASLVRDASESVLNFMWSGTESTNTRLDIYHGDDTLAFSALQNVSTHPEWSVPVGVGIRLTGNWYIKCDAVASEWTLGFQVVR